MPVLLLAVDHRPLVQAEAAGERGRGRRRPTAPVHEGDRVAAVGRNASTSSATRPSASVAYQRQAACGGAGRGRLEGDARTRVPAAQQGGAGVVVLEEEVLDRVPLAPGPPGTVSRRQRVGPFRVLRHQRRPRLRGQQVGGGGAHPTRVWPPPGHRPERARGGEEGVLSQLGDGGGEPVQPQGELHLQGAVGCCQSGPSSWATRSSRWVTVLTCTCSSSAARARLPPAAEVRLQGLHQRGAPPGVVVDAPAPTWRRGTRRRRGPVADGPAAARRSPARRCSRPRRRGPARPARSAQRSASRVAPRPATPGRSTGPAAPAVTGRPVTRARSRATARGRAAGVACRAASARPGRRAPPASPPRVEA